MVACPKCAFENPAEAQFCSDCGTAIPHDQRYCSSCGSPHPPGGIFCADCGEAQPQAAGGLSTVGPVSPPSEVPCPSCHSPVPSRYRFCLQCGASLRGDSPRRPNRLERPPRAEELAVLERAASAERHSARLTMGAGLLTLGFGVVLLTAGWSVLAVLLVVLMAYVLISSHARDQWSKWIRDGCNRATVTEVCGAFTSSWGGARVVVRVGEFRVLLPWTRDLAHRQVRSSHLLTNARFGEMVCVRVRGRRPTVLVLSVKGTPLQLPLVGRVV